MVAVHEHPEGVDPTKESILELVSPTELHFDTRYQRPIDMSWVRKLAAGFDMRRFGVVTTSLREDGRLYVIDGQHRVSAARSVGIERVPVTIYDDLSLGEEAALFSALNTERKRMNPEELYWADFLAGNEEAVGIARSLERSGHRLQRRQRGQRGITCFGALRTAYRYDEGEALFLALQALAAAWGHGENLGAPAIRGVVRFIIQYRGLYDRGRLIQVLEGVTQRRLEALIKDQAGMSGGAGWVGGGKAILALYNRGLRSSKLPPWSDLGEEEDEDA